MEELKLFEAASKDFIWYYAGDLKTIYLFQFPH